jgi:biotin transport system substrate-specific component
MILVALFAALTAIGAYLKIPTQPVPITLQILFCMYAGALLGARLGFLSQLVYVIMGLIGLPVFAGGVGGFSYVLKPSFGYLIGFILCGYIIGKLSENIGQVKGFKGGIKLFGAAVAGLAVVYAIGVPYLYMIFNFYMGKAIDFNTALKWGLYPFIVQDLVKCLVVAITSVRVIPAIRRAGYVKNPKTIME